MEGEQTSHARICTQGRISTIKEEWGRHWRAIVICHKKTNDFPTFLLSVPLDSLITVVMQYGEVGDVQKWRHGEQGVKLDLLLAALKASLDKRLFLTFPAVDTQGLAYFNGVFILSVRIGEVDHIVGMCQSATDIFEQSGDFKLCHPDGESDGAFHSAVGVIVRAVPQAAEAMCSADAPVPDVDAHYSLTQEDTLVKFSHMAHGVMLPFRHQLHTEEPPVNADFWKAPSKTHQAHLSVFTQNTRSSAFKAYHCVNRTMMPCLKHVMYDEDPGVNDEQWLDVVTKLAEPFRIMLLSRRLHGMVRSSSEHWKALERSITTGYGASVATTPVAARPLTLYCTHDAARDHAPTIFHAQPFEELRCRVEQHKTHA